MSESIGAAGGGLPNLNLTPDEKRVYGQLFKEADPDGFGAVSGDVAVRFFEKTRLQPEVLGQIWQIADTENRGFLTPAGFGVVLRLIGHAQAGRTPSVSQAAQPAPLPRFDGNIGTLSPQTTGVPSSPTQSGPPVRVPALGPDKVAEYSALFEKSGAENGMLSGIVAKQIFERAKLPNEVLGRIWGLADTQGRGSLDNTEFVIAMHLLASYKAGAMRGVPSTLPPALYEAASRRGPPRMGGPFRPGSASGLPSGAFTQQTGFHQPPQSPTPRHQTGTPLSSQTTGDWLITSADKSRFDQIFATVDRQGLGYINGEQAVEFFGNARLPEDVLAQIWDLSDVNSEGRLDSDEFAVAMYLIRQQRGSRDGRGVLPATLPPALIPPSKRKQAAVPSQPTAPAFENAPVTQPRSAADDLFGLDVLAQPPTLQAPQSTGGIEAGPFANPTSPVMPPGTLLPTTANTASLFKPFEPSSSFGRSLGPPQSSSPAPAQARNIPATIPENEDLLGDADPTVSSKLTNETSELGNLSNQVGNLSKQMTELQGNRAQAEQELSQTSHQKRAFEGRLAQLRSAYEKEVQEYKTLQEQLTVSRNETKRLQQEMAIIEGSHADLGNQHQQLRAAFEADQRENVALKEKIRLLNTENDSLKPQIEKLKGDARQQKGLVAINKKQLATNEAERDRLKAELNAAQKEIDDAKRDLEESARQIDASKAEIEKAKEAVPTPPAVRSPPAMPSPAASVSSNPFMRRPGAEATFSPPLGSPEAKPDNRDAFDSLFGPSFGAGTNAATVPTTSFRSETPPIKAPETDGSVTPQVIEPPAPPSARQITSDALPLRTNLVRADSLGSSVQVAPPTSRLSPADTPRALTPTTVSSIGEQAQRKDLFEVAQPDQEQDSVRSAVEATTPAVEIPGAFPEAETPRTSTPPQTGGLVAAAGVGTAAVATAAGLAALSNSHDKAEVSQETKAEEKKAQANNFDEYFGGPAHQRTPSEQVKDFDAAFASMKAPGSQPAGKASTQEFPDIQELDDDDDSSSGEEAPLGFEDDFSAKPNPFNAAASTTQAEPQEATSNAAGKQPEIASALPGHLQPRPNLETASSTTSSLPDIERETSPPTYTDAVPNDNPSHFPREYKGLLPEREDPTSQPAGGSSNSTFPPAGNPPSYGPEVTKPQETTAAAAAAVTTSATATKRSTPFDFDSAFSGMAPAQVEDDDSDEAETAFGSSREQANEFDPTFDSPAQTRTATVTSVGSSPAVQHSVTNGTSSTTQPSATEAFYSFGGAATARETNPKTSTAPVTHDFDALFAPLSSSTAFTDAETAVPAQSQATLRPERPQPGRALSTGTEHDDPILKRLTSMGWSRAESLAALEKFDYNIDKAADYLTFRS